MTDTALFLVNAQSGRAQADGPDEIERSLRAVLPPGTDARFVVGAVPDLLDALDGATPATAVTVGGDGTIGAVASALAGRDDAPRFVPLPYGTANLIPRDIGMPMDPPEALRAALAAPVRRIDYATANGAPLLHSAVFGTFAEIAEDREQLREADGPGAWAAALTGAASALIGAEDRRYALTIDGRAEDTVTNTVFVALGDITGADFGVPRRDRLDGGHLTVYLTDSHGPLGFLRRIVEAGTGGLAGSDAVAVHRCETATVTADGPLLYARDGELVEGEDEAVFAIRPGALAVPDLRG